MLVAEPTDRDLNPMTSSLPRKCSTSELRSAWLLEREDGIRTRDPQLGRLMLYQLSYFPLNVVGVDGLEPSMPEGDRVTVWCNSHYATLPSAAT